MDSKPVTESKPREFSPDKLRHISTGPLEEVMKSFEKDCNERGLRDFVSQVPYLERLAGEYLKKKGWYSLLRAHSLYNSCGVRDPQKKTLYARLAYRAQKKYFGAAAPAFEGQQRHVEELKLSLINIRTQFKDTVSSYMKAFEVLPSTPQKLVKQVRPQQYDLIMDQMPQLATEINEQMLRFTEDLMRRSVELCPGNKPCDFSVVAMGSLAKGEATPYSDLEFLFLIQRNDKSTVRYFKQLALTSYFLIGDLGETKLKYMAIPEFGKWFEDQAMNGYKIDGLSQNAGNIPTGNGSKEQHNHFICTPSELYETYKTILDNPDPEEAKRGDKTAALASVVHVFGDERLLTEFLSKIAALTQNKKRAEANMEMLRNDIKKFDFHPNAELVHKQCVKEKMYRFPSLVILALRIIHAVPEPNPWKALKKLEDAGVLSREAAEYLKFTLCCGVYTRLAAYFYYDSQEEHISILPAHEVEARCDRTFYIPRHLLIHMFIHLQPVKAAVRKALDKYMECYQQPELSLQSCNFEVTVDVDRISQLQVVAAMFFYCEDYNSVLEVLPKDYNTNRAEVFRLDPKLMHFIQAFAAIKERKFDLAKDVLDSCDRKEIDMRQCDYWFLRGLLDYNERQAYSKALESHEKSLKEARKSGHRQDIARAYNEIGVVNSQLVNNKEALAAYRNALYMHLTSYASGHLEELQVTEISLSTEKSNGQEEKLIIQLRWNSTESFFVDSNHHIAESIRYLADVYDDMNDHKQAIKYYDRAQEMWRRLCGDRDHSEIALLLNNLGYMNKKMGNYQEAERHYQKSLEMKKRMYKSGKHDSIATAYNNIGQLHEVQGNFSEADRCYKKAVGIWESLKANESLPQAYSNIGTLRLLSQGDCGSALQYFEKSLNMRRQLYPGKDNHPEIEIVENKIRLIKCYHCLFYSVACLLIAGLAFVFW